MTKLERSGTSEERVPTRERRSIVIHSLWVVHFPYQGSNEILAFNAGELGRTDNSGVI